MNELKAYGQKQSMEIFPTDIQYVVWKSAFSSQVIDELNNFPVHLLWKHPSKKLKLICNDKGCYQHGYTDLVDLIEDHNISSSFCINCRIDKFPCIHCCSLLFDYQIEFNLWNYNYSFKF